MRAGFMRRAALFVVAALGAPAGCDGTPDNDQAPLPIDQLAFAINQRYCERAVTCGLAADQLTCQAATGYLDSTAVLTTVAAVRRGTISYDEYLAHTCVRDSFTSCADERDAPSSCNLALQGRVAEGGVCVTSGECFGRGTCNFPASCTDACCSGTCGPPRVTVALAGDCTPYNADCAPGTYCSLSGLCTSQLPVGSVCTADDACAPPAVCDTSSVATGICSIPAEAGASCDAASMYACAHPGYRCDPTSSTCVRRRPPGEPCTQSECVRYALCDAGTCRALPTAGQACSQALACLGALECIAALCTPPAPGTACLPF